MFNYESFPSAQESLKKSFEKNNVETLMNFLKEKIEEAISAGYDGFFVEELGFNNLRLTKAHLEAIKILEEKGYAVSHNQGNNFQRYLTVSWKDNSKTHLFDERHSVSLED